MVYKSNPANDFLDQPPHIPNPVVSRALNETRKVVNAIIREYGKPDYIRIEMARDLKLSKKDKDRIQKQQRLNEKANQRAKEQYQIIRNKNPQLHLSQYLSKAALIRYRLWEEQDQTCVYSGKTISLTQLFSPDIEVDHILPFSRTLNDSFTNKAVCFRQWNQTKGNRTPFEVWGETDHYEHIKQAIRPIKNHAKRNAFYIKKTK